MQSEFLLSFTSVYITKVYLPFCPVRCVVSISTFKPKSDIPSVLKPKKDYFFNPDASFVLFAKKINSGTRIEITYKAGAGNADILPMQIKDGILKHIRLMYTNSDSAWNMEDVDRAYNSFQDFKLSF